MSPRLPESPPWSAAIAPIRRMLSGYASPVRREKILMFLQAMSDDSAADSRDRRLFMAGYLLPAEAWEAFSEAWDAALKRSPRIAYLKMAEAQNRRDQFKGWNEAAKDKKLASLAKVIRRFKPVSFDFSVSRIAFDRIYKPHAPYGLAKPHFLCVLGILSTVLQAVAGARGRANKVKFIFDTQDGVSNDVKLFFEYALENFPPELRALVNGEPQFEDDKQFRPLQAADMLAWHLRREHESGDSLELAAALRGPLHLSNRVEPAVLARWAKIFQAMPGMSNSKDKRQWKHLTKEIEKLAASGFKPPLGNWDEILAELAKHNERSLS